MKLCRWPTACKAAVSRVSRQQVDSLAGGDVQGQGVALEVSGYPYVALVDILERAAERQEPPFILALDLLQNPQNLGVLPRCAEAAGVHGILMPLRRAAGVTEAAVTPR